MCFFVVLGMCHVAICLFRIGLVYTDLVSHSLLMCFGSLSSYV